MRDAAGAPFGSVAIVGPVEDFTEPRVRHAVDALQDVVRGLERVAPTDGA